ncbi:MAG TPA: response regulator [Chloroflexota bacterium]|nr:response regulator [Chloroflexota bacterium]
MAPTHDSFTQSQSAAIDSALMAIAAMGMPDMAEHTAEYATALAQALLAIAQAASALEYDTATMLAESAARLAEYLPVQAERDRVWRYISTVVGTLAAHGAAAESPERKRLLHEGEALLQSLAGATSADSLAAMFDMSEEERMLFGIDDLQVDSADADTLDLDRDPLALFVDENRARLETLALDLAALRSSADDPILRTEVRRAFHTVKGNAALLPVPALERLAKALQTAIDLAPLEAPLASSLIDLLERGHLLIESWLERLESGRGEDRDLPIDGQEALEEQLAAVDGAAHGRTPRIPATARPALLAEVSPNLFSAYLLRLPQDLRALHVALMTLREAPHEPAALADARRALHGLKSRSSMVQIAPLVQIAGQSEDVVEAVAEEVTDGRAVRLIDLIVRGEDLFYQAQTLLQQGTFDTDYPLLADAATQMCQEMSRELAVASASEPLDIAEVVRQAPSEAAPAVEEASQPASTVAERTADPGVAAIPAVPPRVLAAAEPSPEEFETDAAAGAIDIAALARSLADLLAAPPHATMPAPALPAPAAPRAVPAVRPASHAAPPAQVGSGGPGVVTVGVDELTPAALIGPLDQLAALDTLLSGSQRLLGHTRDLVVQQRRNIERLDALVVQLVLEREELRRRNRLLRTRVAQQGPAGMWDELELDSYDAIDTTMVQLSEIVADGRDITHGMRDVLDRLYDGTRRMTSHAGDARNTVLALRMVSLAEQRERLDQVAMAAASRLKRAVRFIMNADVRIDREIAEALEVPLQHMVRNAVVHGIEDQEERRAAGKLAEARVWVHVTESPAGVAIEVGDDGRGLALDRLVDVAVGRGLISGVQAATMTVQQRQELIFQPGLSTADRPSDLAGRGVGMDAVLETVRRIRGSIAIDSQPGRGTVFTLRVPRSLSTALVVIARQGAHEFAIPFEQVIDSHEVRATHLLSTSAGRVLQLDSRLLPVYEIGLLEAVPEVDRGAVRVLLEVDTMQGARGVLVDEVVDVQMTLIDPVPRLLRETPALLGFLPIESGQIRPLLDLRRAVAGATDAMADGRQLVVAPARRHSVLVVDDSPSVRRHLTALFTGAGYVVRQAADGIEALQDIARRGLPSLLTLDMEMPGMDGMEMLNAVRQTYGTALPVFMITSRAQERHRDTTLALGVSRYFNKPFNADELLGAAHLAIAGAPHPAGTDAAVA